MSFFKKLLFMLTSGKHFRRLGDSGKWTTAAGIRLFKSDAVADAAGCGHSATGHTNT